MELKFSKFLREVSMTLFDDKLVHVSKGEHSEVKFDFEYCWSIRKQYKPKTLTMIHVHPDNCLWTSDIDDNMMKGWSTAFFIPINFIVIAKYNSDPDRYGFVKKILMIENNRTVVYDSFNPYLDVYDMMLNNKELKYLINASKYLLLNDFYLYLLSRKMGKKINLPKVML